jgi:hypothetical protein
MRTRRTVLPVTLIWIAALALRAEPQAPPAAAETQDVFEQRVMQVLVTAQTHNPLLPWIKTAPATHYGYGIDLGGGRVLTTEHLVRNHKLVELRRARTGLKIPVTVEISDAQVDLALLRMAPSERDPFPLSAGLAKNVGREQALMILQLDETRELQRGTAQVLQINVTRLPATVYSSLSFKLLTRLNVDGEGAPVLAGTELAGLMLSYDETTRTGEMIPYPVIAQFLDDALTPPYTGFATAGFLWKPLIDPVKRNYFKVEQPNAGIQVSSCIPGTGAADRLKSQDVILEWDGCEIDSLGYYRDPDFGRLPISYLIKGRRAPGSTVPATVIRDGSRIRVDVTLNHVNDGDALIPENVEQEQPEYLVQGGIVIRELTGLYLRSHGNNWERATDPKLVQLYNTRRFMPSHPGEHVVILSRVLPHSINVGYQQFQDRIVRAVNGQPVDNMADVFRIVDQAGGVERLSLDSMGVDLVLERSALKQADSQLAENYGIPQLRYQKKAGSPAP